MRERESERELRAGDQGLLQVDQHDVVATGLELDGVPVAGIAIDLTGFIDIMSLLPMTVLWSSVLFAIDAGAAAATSLSAVPVLLIVR